MSQHMFYKEIPAVVLQELIQNAADEKRQAAAVADSTPPYRTFRRGNPQVEWPTNEQERRFFTVLSQHTEWESANTPNTSLRGAGTTGIAGFRSAEQLHTIWAIIAEAMMTYPKYRVHDLLAEDPQGVEPGSLNEYIRYHYGCAVRNSADIQVLG